MSPSRNGNDTLKGGNRKYSPFSYLLEIVVCGAAITAQEGA